MQLSMPRFDQAAVLVVVMSDAAVTLRGFGADTERLALVFSRPPARFTVPVPSPSVPSPSTWIPPLVMVVLPL